MIVGIATLHRSHSDKKLGNGALPRYRTNGGNGHCKPQLSYCHSNSDEPLALYEHLSCDNLCCGQLGQFGNEIKVGPATLHRLHSDKQLGNGALPRHRTNGGNGHCAPQLFSCHSNSDEPLALHLYKSWQNKNDCGHLLEPLARDLSLFGIGIWVPWLGIWHHPVCSPPWVFDLEARRLCRNSEWENVRIYAAGA